MKTAFIIPGYWNYPGKNAYKKIETAFKQAGYTVHVFHPNWFCNLTNITHDFISLYEGKKSSHNVIFGFSYGAMIAFRASLTCNADKLLLCSLSPYFSEDLKKIPLAYKLMALQRWNDFSKNWKFEELVENFSTPTTILYGENENEYIVERVVALKQVKPGIVESIPVRHTTHDISKGKYILAIQSAISNVNI